MAKRSATHSGHCQACNSLQKLPNGLLSLHGYTVGHGFFSGICHGARALPYELSCDLIKMCVTSATLHMESLQRQQADLRKPATSAVCWVNPYMPANWNGFKGGHVWMQAEIRKSDASWAAFNSTRPEAEHRVEIVFTNEHREARPNMRETQLERNERKSVNLLDIATKQNAERADYLQREINSLKRYIKWQQERVTNWQLRELLPVDAKDKKAAFDPQAVA
jgi:hypothetical protein